MIITVLGKSEYRTEDREDRNVIVRNACDLEVRVAEGGRDTWLSEGQEVQYTEAQHQPLDIKVGESDWLYSSRTSPRRWEGPLWIGSQSWLGPKWYDPKKKKVGAARWAEEEGGE